MKDYAQHPRLKALKSGANSEIKQEGIKYSWIGHTKSDMREEL
jgi:hypothetical protein